MNMTVKVWIWILSLMYTVLLWEVISELDIRSERFQDGVQQEMYIFTRVELINIGTLVSEARVVNRLDIPSGCLRKRYRSRVKRKSLCTPDIELLTVSVRPYYLPREFTNVFLSVLYIPPYAKKDNALQVLRDVNYRLADDKPDSLQIIFGC